MLRRGDPQGGRRGLLLRDQSHSGGRVQRHQGGRQSGVGCDQIRRHRHENVRRQRVEHDQVRGEIGVGRDQTDRDRRHRHDQNGGRQDRFSVLERVGPREGWNLTRHGRHRPDRGQNSGPDRGLGRISPIGCRN